MYYCTICGQGNENINFFTQTLLPATRGEDFFGDPFYLKETKTFICRKCKEKKKEHWEGVKLDLSGVKVS